MSETHVSKAVKEIQQAVISLITVNDELQAMRRSLQAALPVLVRVNGVLEDQGVADEAFNEFVEYMTDRLRDEKWPGNGADIIG